MPKYYENALNLRKALASYEAGYASATGYNKYMYGRRVGEYRSFVLNLDDGIHQIILGTGGDDVCNCALMVPGDSPNPFWTFDGHRNNNGEQTKTFYFFKYEVDKPRQLMLYCQLCQTTRVAVTDEDGLPTEAPKCHKH
jgi:hypothetical protein